MINWELKLLWILCCTKSRWACRALITSMFIGGVPEFLPILGDGPICLFREANLSRVAAWRQGLIKVTWPLPSKESGEEQPEKFKV
jgi:hypothetical protein